MTVRVGHAGHHESGNALRIAGAPPLDRAATSMRLMCPSSATVTSTSRTQPCVQQNGFQMVLSGHCLYLYRQPSLPYHSIHSKPSGAAVSSKEWDRVWIGADIATMVAGGEPYGKLKNAALAVKGERIAWIGPAAEARRTAAARGHLRRGLPGPVDHAGLIDCHTHLVYGGDRVEEFEKRLCGVSYEEIARAGGGIQSTVNATRASGLRTRSPQAAAVRARRLMSEGVTTIEVKSGYGLELATERRMLEVARALERELPVSIKTTYLGLHALPQEYRDVPRRSTCTRERPLARGARGRGPGGCGRCVLREHRLLARGDASNSCAPRAAWDCPRTCTRAN